MPPNVVERLVSGLLGYPSSQYRARVLEESEQNPSTVESDPRLGGVGYDSNTQLLLTIANTLTAFVSNGKGQQILPPGREAKPRQVGGLAALEAFVTGG